MVLILSSLAGEGTGAGALVEVFHRGDEIGTVRAIKAKAASSLEKLESEFGLPLNGPVKIILVSSRAEFDSVQPHGAKLPTWAAGVAYPKENLIIIKSRRVMANLDLDRVLAHELAHLALGRVFKDHVIPLWLNEGLTMHLADDWGVDRQLAMLRAISNDRLIKVKDLVAGFPENSLDAKTAYAQSYYLVAFLRDRWGFEVMGRLIRYLGAGVSAEYALNRATGLRMWELEDDFRIWLNRRFSIFWILTGPFALWTLAVFLLVAAYIIRKRAAAKKMAQWEAEENESEIDSFGP